MSPNHNLLNLIKLNKVTFFCLTFLSLTTGSTEVLFALFLVILMCELVSK